MEWEMTSIILGIVVVFLSIFAVSTYLGTHINNGLCENKYTHELSRYTDYGEGVSYPLWLSDCCYDEARAEKVCRAHAVAVGVDPSSLCEDLSKNNPATLFSCVESTKLCNNETCVQSCNNDNICQRNLGEGYWCGDCQ